MEPEIFEIKRLLEAKEKESQCYGGTFFANWFMVDNPVFLHGVGFFGPEKVDMALYEVHIDLVKVWGPKMSKELKIFSTKVSNVEGKKGQIFQVKFAQPIAIPSNCWIKILFDLGKGTPKTAKAEPKNVQTRVTLKVNRDSNSQLLGNEVNFDFLVGSGQMPSIFVSIP